MERNRQGQSILGCRVARESLLRKETLTLEAFLSFEESTILVWILRCHRTNNLTTLELVTQNGYSNRASIGAHYNMKIFPTSPMMYGQLHGGVSEMARSQWIEPA